MDMTRAQMHALIYALERDMRDILRRYAAIDGDISALLRTQEREGAESRRIADERSAEDLLEYLDLRPTYDLLNRHKETLPASLALEVSGQFGAIESIIPIRRRLAHSRPLESEDSDRLRSALMGFQHVAWRSLRVTREQLADPQWVPPMHERIFESDRVLHNVPIPDYDETTLIGREDFVEKVVGLVTGGRNRVVTITGEGGIGKTAVAYAVAHHILDSEQTKFDAVLWVSLKKERLTGAGIEQIKDAVESLHAASVHLGRQIDSDFVGGLESLGDMLEGLRILICFDNLETISGDEFVSLYEALPDSVQYLVTSRNGIGQLERRLQLGPLKSHHAVALLGRLISTQQAKQLAGLSAAGKSALCKDLRYSPLAIKWFVLAAASGRPVSGLMRNQEELLTFCVQSVYERLSQVARRILVALHLLGREGSLGELAILIDEPVSVLAKAMQELVQGSLVVSRVADTMDMETLLALTETANAYLKNAISPDDPDLLTVASLEAKYRRSEEVRQKNAAGRSLAPWIVRTTNESERPAAHLLHQALQASKSGNWDEAMRIVARARELAPDYWEVHRVDAFIAASGRLLPDGAVTQIYLRALSLADSDLAKGVVSHFLAGHMARNVNDLSEALAHAEVAHAAIGSAETEMALGNYYVRAGKFEVGIAQLEEAVNALRGRSNLIARTSLMGAYRRYAEAALYQERSVGKALERCMAGIEIGVDLQSEGVFDYKYFDEFCELNALLFGIERHAYEHEIKLVLPAGLFLELLPGLDRLRQSASFPILQRACAGVSPRMESETGFDAYARRVSQNTGGLPTEETCERRLVGMVCNLKPKYGFIQHPMYPENVFFHESAVSSELRFDTLMVGAKVAFEVYEEQDRIKASWVGVAP